LARKKILGEHRKKRKGETHKMGRKGQNFEKERSKVLRDDRKEKVRLTKWEKKGQSFERKSSLRF